MNFTVASTLSRENTKKPQTNRKKIQGEKPKRELYTKFSLPFWGFSIQNTNKLTESSLLTHEHKAILLNNCPKTPPTTVSQSLSPLQQEQLSCFKTDSEPLQFTVQLIKDLNQSLIYFTTWSHTHNLLKVWHNYEHMRGCKFRSRAGS